MHRIKITLSAVPTRKEKVAMIITKCTYNPMEKKKKTEIKYQVQNGALITRCRHLTTGSAVIARSNAKYQGGRDQRIKPKFPRNFSFPCYKEGDEIVARWTQLRCQRRRESPWREKIPSGPERNKRGAEVGRCRGGNSS